MAGSKTVLVVGATGVVGYATAKAFSADPDWEVITMSRREPPRLSGTRHLPVDLQDRDAVALACQSLGEVTHVVYAALFEKPGLIPGWYERDQMDANLAMLQNLMDPLTAVASDLHHVTLMQGTKAYGAHVEPMKVPGREREPRHNHENFYWLQEDDLRGRQSGQEWSWTIMRPQIIFGEALGSNMNPIPALGVYAALMNADGEPLHFPGGVAITSEAVDADLLGRAIKWAAETPSQSANEIFNVTNGDVFNIKNLWPAIADAFGMEPGEDRPLSLAEAMPARQSDWAELVARHDLIAPVDLAAFVGQSFIYADVIMGYGATEARPSSFVSTIKLRQAGFGECIDTEDMFRKWIKHFQDLRLFPKR
jgi:nucleoside-diphosphate-sugar epimerase